MTRGQRAESESRVYSRLPAGSKQAAGPGPSAVRSHIKSTFPRVVLPVVEVRVTAESGHSAATYALLDKGSTNTFWSAGLLHKLRSQGQKASLGLTKLEGEDSKLKTSVPELEVSDTKGQQKVTVHQAYASPSIPVFSFYVVKPEDLERWEHLRDVDIPVITDGQMVEMLIGQDCPENFVSRKIRASEQPGAVSAPFATRTLFGWIINGSLGDQTGVGAAASVNFVTLEQQVEQFWKIEGAQ